MSEHTDVKQPKRFGMRVKLALVSLMTMIGLVGTASATSINDTIGPILEAVALLFTPLLALIMAAIPVMIVMAIVAFILGLLTAILNKIKM